MIINVLGMYIYCMYGKICKYDLVINSDLFYVLELLLKVFVVYELVYFKEKDYNKVFY